MKIPSLIETAQGTLLAFAEARTPDCGDFSRTDLVYKRSTDGGKSWSEINRLVAPRADDHGICGNPVVVGNAAPVQLSATVSGLQV
jgi:sialidase-1